MNPLSELLKGHLADRHWSFDTLSHATGLPRNTIYRWIKGGVHKVRDWRDLIKVAEALGLDRFETNHLLECGGNSTIDVLAEEAKETGEEYLLARWMVTPDNNLPHFLTSFFGREAELGQLANLLVSARLITLMGPGGSGKSRLALEIAHAVLDRFDGVYVVDLAPVRDPALVIPTIARTLAVHAPDDDQLPRELATHLRDRHTLLILDNFEQIVEAGPLVTDLLRQTRWTRAIVTSRVPLMVRGEHTFAVPPLTLPDPEASFAEIAQNPAVQLFANRARAADAAFVLTREIAPLVAEICVDLDGLPLAIELAATRIREVGVRSMRDRFPTRLAIADIGPRDVPDRQRTLRATIAWSYDLLTEPEQRLLDTLGVFIGGFTAEAVNAVCAGDDPAASGLAVLERHALILPAVAIAGDARFEMLETIREFAAERLEATGRLADTRARHAAYALDLAEGADLEGVGQATWLQRLAVDHANVRAALGWYRDQGDVVHGLRLSLALVPFWRMRDHVQEARAWLATFVTEEARAWPALYGRGLLWSGLLLMRSAGETAASREIIERALSLLRELGDEDGVCEALHAKGDLHRQLGDWATARPLYAESILLAQRTGNVHLLAHGYWGMALCAQEDGDFLTATHYWELTLQAQRDVGNLAGVSLNLNSLGEMARARKAWDEARSSYQQGLDLAHQLESEFRIALSLHNLAYVALATDGPEAARALFVDSLLRYADQEHGPGIAECLAGLAHVALAERRLVRAATLCGAAEKLLADHHARLDALDRLAFEDTVATLQDQMAEKYVTFMEEGRAMSLAEAIAYAAPDVARGRRAPRRS